MRFCYVPASQSASQSASIAIVIPRSLSRIFLEPLFGRGYPNSVPFVHKKRCLLGRTVRYTYAFLLQKARKLIASCISVPHAFST